MVSGWRSSEPGTASVKEGVRGSLGKGWGLLEDSVEGPEQERPVCVAGWSIIHHSELWRKEKLECP